MDREYTYVEELRTEDYDALHRILRLASTLSKAG